jgi:flagellar biosynthesis/type III secretory pathway protein FliH
MDDIEKYKKDLSDRFINDLPYTMRLIEKEILSVVEMAFQYGFEEGYNKGYSDRSAELMQDVVFLKVTGNYPTTKSAVNIVIREKYD